LQILVSLLLALLPAVVVPLVLLRLWNQAVAASDFRGGMWYFPTTPFEWLFGAAFLISIVPFLIVLIVLLIPVALLVQFAGLHFTLTLPLGTLPAQVDAAFTITGSIALSFQIVVWSMLIGRIQQQRGRWSNPQPWSH
jgi:hypothetical protein